MPKKHKPRQPTYDVSVVRGRMVKRWTLPNLWCAVSTALDIYNYGDFKFGRPEIDSVHVTRTSETEATINLVRPKPKPEPGPPTVDEVRKCWLMFLEKHDISFNNTGHPRISRARAEVVTWTAEEKAFIDDVLDRGSRFAREVSTS